MNKKKTHLEWALRIVPRAIDLAMLAGAFLFVPWFGSQLYSPTITNYLVLAPGFLLILAGIIAIRNLPKYSFDDEAGPSLFAACLALILMVVYLMLFAYGTNIGGSEGNNDTVITLGFFLFLPMILTAFYWPVKKTKPETKKALIAESIGLFSVNYLTLLGAAVWYQFSHLPTVEDPVYATGIPFFMLYIILIGIFIVSFGLPRIYLLRATRDKIGLIAYILSVAIFLWDKVPPVN